MNVNVKKLAIPAMCLGLLGVAGGAAASQAFKPVEQPKTQVQLVQPAAETVTVTPEPAPTTTTVAPRPVKKAAVKPAPVQSTTKATSSAATVQRQATVATEPAPETSAPVVTPSSDYTPPADSAAASMLRKMKNPPSPAPPPPSK